jgi:hypothetical protein
MIDHKLFCLAWLLHEPNAMREGLERERIFSLRTVEGMLLLLMMTMMNLV